MYATNAIMKAIIMMLMLLLPLLHLMLLPLYGVCNNTIYSKLYSIQNSVNMTVKYSNWFNVSSGSVLITEHGKQYGSVG